MDVSEIYALAADGLFVLIMLVNCLASLSENVRDVLLPSALRHLVYPFLISRHRLLGPCTRLRALLQAIYWGLAASASTYGTHSFAALGVRAGTLSLVNAAMLYSGLQLGFLADALGLRLPTVRWLHGSIGLVSWALALLHVIINITGNGQMGLDTSSRVYGLMVSRILDVLLMKLTIDACHFLDDGRGDLFIEAFSSAFIRALPSTAPVSYQLIPLRGLAAYQIVEDRDAYLLLRRCDTIGCFCYIVTSPRLKPEAWRVLLDFDNLSA
jgi:hypothetical protein